MKTTLNKIRDHSPCINGWKRLLKYLNKTEEDDEELRIETIIKSNGVADAIWCLKTVDGYEKELKLFTIFCARQVQQHLMTDKRSIKALDVAEDYINGKATIEELVSAVAAAHCAADYASDYAADHASYAAADYAPYAVAYYASCAAYYASYAAYADYAYAAYADYASSAAADYASSAAAAYDAVASAAYDAVASAAYVYAVNADEEMRKIQAKELLRICSLNNELK